MEQSLRISKIIISNFRAFFGETTIDLTRNGKNLLLYGENGSGKTSLFKALDSFFYNKSIRPLFNEFRNIFSDPENDNFVKIEISDCINPPETYEWSQNSNPPHDHIIINQASKNKGFFNYKTILKTYCFLSDFEEIEQVNLFDFVITLIGEVRNPISLRKFSEEYDLIQHYSERKKSKTRDVLLLNLLDDFNNGLEFILSKITEKTNELINYFQCNINVKFDFGKITIIEKKANTGKISLIVTYFEKEIPSHHCFLNEARLSAIGLSLILSTLLISPVSDLRLLFLDDIVIGLDISNRLPLLNILTDCFSGWQIFISTYDWTWFQMAKNRLEINQSRWCFAKIYETLNFPVFVCECNFLNLAKKHLEDNDFTASAIYLRCEFERLLMKFAEKHCLKIQYKTKQEKIDTEMFWNEIKKCTYKDDRDQLILDESLISLVEKNRACVLNKLAHYSSLTLCRNEIEESVKTIENLGIALKNLEDIKIIQPL